LDKIVLSYIGDSPCKQETNSKSLGDKFEEKTKVVILQRPNHSEDGKKAKNVTSIKSYVEAFK